MSWPPNPECTMLYADVHVDRYREDPLVAAEKLSEIWCNNQTTHVDVWGCDWPCEAFFEKFLDRCREKGFLKEALKIWWCVHNCPGSETEPCHHDMVCQQVIDYSVKYGLESETIHLKEHGLDKFTLLDQIYKLYKGYELHKIMAHVYPNPKDENGRFIPLIKDKDGNAIHWPKNSDGIFLTPAEVYGS